MKKICIMPNYNEENLYYAKFHRIKSPVYTDKISRSVGLQYPPELN